MSGELAKAGIPYVHCKCDSGILNIWVSGPDRRNLLGRLGGDELFHDERSSYSQKPAEVYKRVASSCRRDSLTRLCSVLPAAVTRRDELGPPLEASPLLKLRALLVCLEREVDENSAEEDPKGYDR
jgi:hypothetical protein